MDHRWHQHRQECHKSQGLLDLLIGWLQHHEKQRYVLTWNKPMLHRNEIDHCVFQSSFVTLSSAFLGQVASVCFFSRKIGKTSKIGQNFSFFFSIYFYEPREVKESPTILKYPLKSRFCFFCFFFELFEFSLGFSFLLFLSFFQLFSTITVNEKTFS